jgi:hypothetical protein
MGRDDDPRSATDAVSSAGVVRTATACAVLGGIAWIATAFVGSASTDRLLHWVGGVLVTVALAVIGLLMVKSGVLALRLFVAVALPVLVWGVVAILRQSETDDGVLDAVFGVVVGLGSGVVLARRSRADRATL